jgi:hypothetical protein
MMKRGLDRRHGCPPEADYYVFCHLSLAHLTLRRKMAERIKRYHFSIARFGYGAGDRGLARVQGVPRNPSFC